MALFNLIDCTAIPYIVLTHWLAKGVRRMSRNLPSAAAVNIGGGTVQQILREPEASVRGHRAKEGVGLPYLPGLDGLRALAVIAVLLYHAGLPWLPGGFLGVEVFFVISGYLITALLLAEQRQRGRIDIKGFWFRRARRLLPALYLVLAATLAFAVVFLPEEVAGRSEEHTSELQSHSDLVCRLLLEKKKK